jgi:hypothetical protein
MGIACDLNAIDLRDRVTYRELVSRLRTAIRGYAELADGYDFEIDPIQMRAVDVERWVSFARLCCPFLSIDVSGVAVRMRGPAEAKQIIHSQFVRKR